MMHLPLPGRSVHLLMRFGPPLLVVVIVVLIDQATKAVVRWQLEQGEAWPASWDVVRIVHVTNSGAAFGWFQDHTATLVAVTVGACAWVVWLIYRSATVHRWYAFGLSLLLAGALGNMVDRIRLGEATDMIRPLGSVTFNVADVAIVAGVLMVVLLAPPDRDDDVLAAAPSPADAPPR